MNRVLCAIGIILLLAASARGQEPPVEIPPVERKPYSAGGILEARPAIVWFDPNAALFKLQSSPEDARDARTLQLNSRVQLDAAYRWGWFSAQTRTVVESGYASGNWSGNATAYKAYLSLKPAPSLTVDAGKKTFKWGKGYLWTPSRPSSTERKAPRILRWPWKGSWGSRPITFAPSAARYRCCP